MSNQLTVEVVKTVDPYATDVAGGEIVWIAYDDYGRHVEWYGDKDISDFVTRFPTVQDLLADVLSTAALEDLASIDTDGTIIFHTCNSIEVHGYFPDGEVFVETA